MILRKLNDLCNKYNDFLCQCLTSEIAQSIGLTFLIGIVLLAMIGMLFMFIGYGVEP